MSWIPLTDAGAVETASNYSSTIADTAANIGKQITTGIGNAAASVGAAGSAFAAGVSHMAGTASAATATLAGMTVPLPATMIGVAAASALGVAMGENWYENNPELWNSVGEAIYNLNPELSEDVYNGAGAAWAWVNDGQVYVDPAVVQAVQDVLAEYGVLSDNYQSPTPGTGISSTMGFDDIIATTLGSSTVQLSNLYASIQLPALLARAKEVVNFGTITSVEIASTQTESGWTYPAITVETWDVDLSTLSYSINDSGCVTLSSPQWTEQRLYNIVAEYYNNEFRRWMDRENTSGGNTMTGYLPNDTFASTSSGFSSTGERIGIGSLEYPGLAKQRDATIVGEGESIIDAFPGWIENALSRVVDWTIDATGAIATTLADAIPLSIPMDLVLDIPLDLAQSLAQAGSIAFDPSVYYDMYNDLVNYMTVNNYNTFQDPETDNVGIVPDITLPSGDAQALFTVYNPSQAEINTFGAWLWSSDFLDNLVKIIENPIDCIISLKKIFVPPSTGGSGTIYCGFLASDASASLVNAQYVEYDLGSVEVPEYFKDATDYAPYTSVSCFLPFIGMVELSTYDVIGATVSIKYVVDCYNGDFMAHVRTAKGSYSGVTYTFSGNCAVEYPITGSNHAALALGAAVTGVTALATGGLSLAGVAGMAGSLGGQQSINGQMNGNAGACGNKTPYIIVKRPKQKAAAGYNNYYGYPTSKLMSIGNCTGYTRVKAVITNGIAGASDAEIEEIENLLKDGIIA